MLKLYKEKKNIDVILKKRKYEIKGYIDFSLQNKVLDMYNKSLEYVALKIKGISDKNYKKIIYFNLINW